MSLMRPTFHGIALGLGIFLVGSAIDAQAASINWSVTIGNPVQFGTRGTTMVYSGAIVNETGSDLFLDTAFIGFNTSVSPSAYTKDFADEFLATLGIIPTSGYSGPLFFVRWLAGAPDGATGTGTFELTAASPASPVLLAPAFEASLGEATGVPEPDTFTLIWFASGGVAIARHFRRRPRAT